MPSNYEQCPLISSPVYALSSLVPMTKIPKPPVHHLPNNCLLSSYFIARQLEKENTRSRLAKEHAKEIHRFLLRDSTTPVASLYMPMPETHMRTRVPMHCAAAKKISEQQL